MKTIKPIRIEQKVRCIGLQMAQCTWYGGMPPDTIWADCIKCDQSIVLHFKDVVEARLFTDQQATEIVNQHGWTIKPTLCPQCVELSR